MTTNYHIGYRPEKVDRKFWDEFIMKEVEEYLNGGNGNDDIFRRGVYETFVRDPRGV